MRVVTFVLILSLSGCAITGSKESVVGCQVADTVTTIVALEKGAVEMNPLVAGIIDVAGYPGLIVFKLGVAYLLYKTLERQEKVDKRVAYTAGTLMNAITCGAAVNNINVINKL